MAVSEEYKVFVIEMLEGLGPVTIRRMFGGGGVYADDLMFGLIADETLYFKVDDGNRAAFEAEGMAAFKTPGRQIAMSYYEVPPRLYDEPEELVVWAREALSAAMRNRKPKKSATRKTRKD